MSSIGSYDSDNASGFWDPPSKPIKEEFKSEQDQESNNYSDSYHESLSESEDFVSEKELGCVRELESKDYNNNKNGRTRTGKAEDAGKPFYVPRKPHFFEHDIRILDDEEEVREKRKRNVRKTQDSNCWNHDLFIEDEQKPKSKRELIDMYGYDIRSDSPTSIGESSCRERRPKRQSYYNPDNHLKYNINYEEMEKESSKHKLRMDSTQSAHKDCSGFKERNYCKKVLPKKTSSATNSYDVDILKMEKLSIHPSETRNKVLNPQCCPVDFIPVTYPGSMRREPPPPKIVFLDREKTNLKYVVNPRVVNGADLPNCSQTHQKESSNLKDNTITLHSPKENRNKMTENKSVSRCYNLKSNRAYNENKSVHGPLNVSERKLSELDNNDVVDSLVPMNTAPSTYNYFNGLYNESNRENFEFPDPPDLSANHLMPCIPQQQYFLHPYYQQGLGSLMKWEFYGQPYYQRGTLGDVAFMKQQYFDSWASPHQSNVISSTQHVDSNPFYAVRDNVKIVQQDTEVKCVSTVERADQVASVPVHRTSHRYSYVRAMLHQVHSAKILKVDDSKEQ